MLRASTFLGGEPASVLVGCAPRVSEYQGGVPCVTTRTSSKPTAFEVTSKRRKGFPSEARVKRGERVVGGSKELLEKLGRNDPCPCNSGHRFQTLLHAHRRVRRLRPRALLLGSLRGARRASRDESLCTAPNSALQRTGTHKVLGRGRPSLCLTHGRWRARVLMRRRAVAELGS
jgi:hypothetical protein